jgi:hypothetical protein
MSRPPLSNIADFAILSVSLQNAMNALKEVKGRQVT